MGTCWQEAVEDGHGTLLGRCLSWPQEKGDTCSDRPHCCKCRFLRELHLTTPSLSDTSVSSWTATGQRMIHATVMLWTEQLRRADNVPYTRAFAEGFVRAREAPGMFSSCPGNLPWAVLCGAPQNHVTCGGGHLPVLLGRPMGGCSVGPPKKT